MDDLNKGEIYLLRNRMLNKHADTYLKISDRKTLALDYLEKLKRLYPLEK